MNENEDIVKQIQRLEDESRTERKEMRHMIADVQNTQGLLQQSLGTFETNVNEKFRIIDRKIDPVVAAYNGFLFGNKMIMGASGLIIALGTIGAGFLWLFHRQ